MIKKCLALTLLCSAAICHAECSIDVQSANEDVIKVISERGLQAKAYDEVCKKLQRGNAKLLIIGAATVLSNHSIGWASVMVQDAKLAIFTNEYGGQFTRVNTFASMDKAEELLHTAIIKSIDTADFDLALKSLDLRRKAARAAAKK